MKNYGEEVLSLIAAIRLCTFYIVYSQRHIFAFIDLVWDDLFGMIADVPVLVIYGGPFISPSVGGV